MDHAGTDHGKVAKEFASALIAGQFENAHRLLATALRSEWTIPLLQRTFEEMVEWFDTPPGAVEVVETMIDWPAKVAGDIGWAYVAIMGDDGSEAVTVTVCSEDGRHLIRDIEWGRP